MNLSRSSSCLPSLSWSLHLQEEELKDAILLVFANKQVRGLIFMETLCWKYALHYLLLFSQDMPNAMTPAEVSEGLGLAALKNRQWQLFKTSAVKGEGLNEGLDWYSSRFHPAVSPPFPTSHHFALLLPSVAQARKHPAEDVTHH